MATKAENTPAIALFEGTRGAWASDFCKSLKVREPKEIPMESKKEASVRSSIGQYATRHSMDIRVRKDNGKLWACLMSKPEVKPVDVPTPVDTLTVQQ